MCVLGMVPLLTAGTGLGSRGSSRGCVIALRSAIARSILAGPVAAPHERLMYNFNNEEEVNKFVLIIRLDSSVHHFLFLFLLLLLRMLEAFVAAWRFPSPVDSHI